MNRKELKKGFKQDLKSHIYFNVNNQVTNDNKMSVDDLIKKVNNGFCEIFGITIELTEQEKKEVYEYYLNQYFYKQSKC